MKNIISKKFYILAALLAFFVCICTLIQFGGVGAVANAAVSNRAGVLDDLQKDESFDVSQYPADSKDYRIYVLQIAESAGGSLYLYTYQPCMGSRILLATDINMSFRQDAVGTELYSLRLLSFSGVFAKYIVNDVEVSSDAIRYYNIASIYRAWDKDIDTGTGNSNTIDKKAYPVGNIWTAATMRGEVIYDRQPTYVVNIINPYTGYLCFDLTEPDYWLSIFTVYYDSWHAVDAHYISFSTDWEIDKLMSASLSYEYRSVKGNSQSALFNIFQWDNVEYGQYQPATVDVPDVKVTVEDHKWYGGGHTYSWDRIQTGSEFIRYGGDKLSEEDRDNIKNNQWVLMFTETERISDYWNVPGTYDNLTVYSTEITAVSVLRLEFEANGVVYNLGAVSDVLSGDFDPGIDDKPPTLWDEFWDGFLGGDDGDGWPWWAWVIIAVLALFVVVIVLYIFGLFFPIIKDILHAIWDAIKFVLWWTVCLPFRGIAWIIQKVRSKE